MGLARTLQFCRPKACVWSAFHFHTPLRSERGWARQLERLVVWWLRRYSVRSEDVTLNLVPSSGSVSGLARAVGEEHWPPKGSGKGEGVFLH